MDRGAVAAAADAIDASLEQDPLSEGESREAGTRILIVPPLAVLFDVLEQDRVVSVWAVFGRE